MKLFTNESIYDAQTDKWKERFWIDGKIVDEDLYFFEMDREKYLEIEKLKKQEDEIENECDCPECTLDRYSQLLSEITGGCCGCIRSVLESFLDTVIDHLVIEDMEEDMID